MLFESDEGFAIEGLHAKLGVRELLASVRADFINGTGFLYQKRARVIGYILVVFCFVSFPNSA